VYGAVNIGEFFVLANIDVYQKYSEKDFLLWYTRFN